MTEWVSTYLIAAATAWLGAQLLKYAINAVKSGGIHDYKWLYRSGDMPSAHMATMAAVTTVIAYVDGLHSGIFALALVVTAIIGYDAMYVRRSSGEQGVALEALLRKAHIKKMPHRAFGHKPTEVIAGLALGCTIGLMVVFSITYF